MRKGTLAILLAIIFVGLGDLYTMDSYLSNFTLYSFKIRATWNVGNFKTPNHNQINGL